MTFKSHKNVHEKGKWVTFSKSHIDERFKARKWRYQKVTLMNGSKQESDVIKKSHWWTFKNSWIWQVSNKTTAPSEFKNCPSRQVWNLDKTKKGTTKSKKVLSVSKTNTVIKVWCGFCRFKFTAQGILLIILNLRLALFPKGFQKIS